ncbi:MAG: sulfurtransferase complex subunit TusB [Gammaproteobacteria bacterium]
MLHIISHSLSDSAVLQRIAPHDAALFIRDAVLGLLGEGRWAEQLRDLQPHCKLYALQPDLEVRGIVAEELLAGIETVDYGGFVALTLEHPVIYAWH